MRSPIAHEIPPNRMPTDSPGPRNRRGGLFRKLERRGSPEGPCHDNPETRQQEARLKSHRVTISLRL